MPIVDGLTSTKMIRALEKSPEHAGHSHLAAANGRIPIFAVSASLVEKERSTYMDAGFDGWILKPIDFKRLHELLTGIDDEETRRDCMYSPGEWERGGWFCLMADLDKHESGNDEVTPRAVEDNMEMTGHLEHPAQAAAAESDLEVVPESASESVETAPT